MKLRTTDGTPMVFEPSINCGCGHTAPIDAFTTRPITGELPPGHYQCPSCHKAWKIVKTPITITPWGTVISEPNKVEATHPAL